MSNNASIPLTLLAFAIFFFLYLSLSFHSQALSDNKHAFRSLVKKDQWKSIVVSEYGEISAINIPDEIKRDTYHIQFLTLEPNSLFLPAILNADMVFYVHTGSGRLSWVDKDEDKIKRVALRRGDIYRLQPGSVFQIQCNLENERQKLRIYAIFTSTDDDFNLDPSVRAYSCIADLVRGFDSKTLQAAFKVSEEVIEAIKNSTERQMIVHTMSKTNDDEETKMELESPFLKAFIHNKKKKKADAYNILDEDPDFKNSNGWSTTVTKKTSHLLKGSNVGVFMVNLTKGSMMGPHWNPKATEIAIVLQGQGMITIVSSNITENMRFKVSEGDVFKISRFHPMAQISFNNETFVFMGFSTSTKKNHPQFLAGKSSVLQTLDNDVLAMSFGVNDSTIDRLLASQVESVILECNSCAEEMERKMEEEIEKERKEEERKRQEEEEKRKREDEEEKRKREEKEEEEEKRKREEEEAKKKQEEEQRKREEDEARQRQEDEKEEEARKKQEEEQRKREEEEARQGQEEEEEQRRREEEEARQRQEDEKEEEARKKQEEEQRKREEEEARQGQEEEEEQRRREEEEARQRQEDEKEEEARKKQEEEQRKREEEEARQRQEEEEEEEQRRREEEEARKREERQKQEQWKRKEKERERRKKQLEERRKGKEEEESEQEKARRQAKERERRRKEYDQEEQKEWDEGSRSEEYADEGKYLKLKSHLEDNYMNVN